MLQGLTGLRFPQSIWVAVDRRMMRTKEDDWRIYQVGSKFRSSQTRLATYRAASPTVQEEEPERLRANGL